MRRCLTIANEAFPQTGIVGDELARRGLVPEPVLREGRLRWPDLHGVELVLVLGSDWSVYDPETHDVVQGEVALVREAHRCGVPVLGICFGAQVLAAALGGRVHRAPAMELGWTEIEPLHPALEPGPWMQWHQDTFTPPAGVEVLARSPIGPQAIRAGRSFAVQFHPELDAEMMAAWVDEGGRTLAEEGVDPAALLARTAAELPRAEGACRRLVGWFCESVAGREDPDEGL